MRDVKRDVKLLRLLLRLLRLSCTVANHPEGVWRETRLSSQLVDLHIHPLIGEAHYLTSHAGVRPADNSHSVANGQSEALWGVVSVLHGESKQQLCDGGMLCITA